MDSRVGTALMTYRILYETFGKELLALLDQIEQHFVDLESRLKDPYDPELGPAKVDTHNLQIFLEDFYPQTVRTAFFVAIFADMDFYFVRLSHEVQSAIEQNPPSSQLKPNSIDKARKYLMNTAKLNIPDSLWEQIHFLKLVRNVIVHSGRRLMPGSAYHSDVLAHLKKRPMPSLAINDSGDLTLLRDFNRDAFLTFSSLFEKLGTCGASHEASHLG